MEEPIWLFFGIISIIITLGIIGHVSMVGLENRTESEFENSIIMLGEQCNFVCSASIGNILGVKVSLPSGSVINASDDIICGQYNDVFKCSRCSCEIDDYTIDLSGDGLAKKFRSHDYDCRFERDDDEVVMECIG